MNDTVNALGVETLKLRLRLCEVQRWGIVAMARPQSVAEHTLRMMVLAKEIYRILTATTSHNSFDKAAVAEMAIDHDLEEVLSGDLNAPLKMALEGIAPGAYKLAVQELSREVSPEAQAIIDGVEAQKRAAKGGVLEFCLKFADLLESLLYAMDYAVGARREYALNDISQHMLARWEAAVTAMPSLGWAGLHALVRALIPEYCPALIRARELVASPYPLEGED